MKRALKIILVIIIAVIVLLAAALFVITQVINPNDFKPQIREQALKEANLDLRIPGNLSWQFWPSLGVSVGRTEARIAGQQELFAAIDNASVSVAVLPLLVGKVEMDGVDLDGLDLNLKKTANGANWQQIHPQNKSAEQPETTNDGKQESSGGMDIPLTIPSVAITNSKVRYQDTTNGTDIRVEHFNFHATDVNFQTPFPLEASLRYQDQNDIRVDLDLKTTLSADINANHYLLKPMTLDAEVAGITSEPVKVHLQQNLDVNLQDGSAKIVDLVLEAAGTRTTGNATVTGLTDNKLKVTGRINTEPFDANKVLTSIGEKPIETSDSNALSKIALHATLAGNPGSVMLDPLKITLDNSTISGNAGLADLNSGKIQFDLNLDKIALDGYLPPSSNKTASGEKKGNAGSTGGGKTGGTARLSDKPLIPVDSLRPLKLDGIFTIGQLSYQGIEASKLAFKVSANNGVLKLTQAEGQALGGSFNATASLNAAGKTPALQAQANIKHMQLQPVAKLAAGRDLAKGILDLNANFSASGNSEKALVSSAKGNANVDLSDGIVRGLNLYNTLIGGINNLLGRFQALSALIPNQQSGKLPKALSEDTKIIDLTTKVSLAKQVANLDSLQAKLEKGTVSGKGWLNTLTRDFDLDIGMKSPELSGGKYLKDTTWPLNCSGNLAGNPAKWCGPDYDGFEDIAKQAAANAAKQRIKDKLGIDAEGDSTEEVLKNAAKKKAQEEINKKLGDKLKGLFH